MSARRKLSAVATEMSAELAASIQNDEDPPIVEEKYPFLPSASKTDLLFACTWPWNRLVARGEVGERARFGSAFHEFIEAKLIGKPHPKDLAASWGIDAEELATRVEEAFPVIARWLDGDNLWGIRFQNWKTEVSTAYNPRTDEARLCDPPTEDTHDYADRQPGEIPGTTDLMSLNGKTLLVLDHKSGWNVAADWQPRTPAENGQLRTLALTLARLHKGVARIIVGFFHAPASGLPQVLADELSLGDLETHRKNLKQAMNNIGTGWMRPGVWCSHCPAWSECPTQQSALVELKRGSGALTASRVGAIHQATAAYDGLRERLREEMRVWVKMNGPGIRPDGQAVDLVEKEVSNLSQASILRALGPLKGAKEIKRLEGLGCIEKRPRLELRAVKR